MSPVTNTQIKMSETDLDIQEAEEEVPDSFEIEDEVHVESKYKACIKIR